jgi:hypothetical protein
MGRGSYGSRCVAVAASREPQQLFQNGATVAALFRSGVRPVIYFLLVKELSREKNNRKVRAVYGANVMIFKGVSH